MTLLVMAAGMGSRYGGLKQMDPIGPNGEFILDYTIRDAVRAGFDKAVIVIKKENEEAFRETVGNRIGKYIEVEYAFQDLHDMPAGFTVPEGRVKQWGTGHAVLAARGLIKGGFAAVNADDLYGQESFEIMHNFLANENQDACGCMAGFILKNTLTENGTVARGVCECSEDGLLLDIQERTKIARGEDGRTAYFEDGIWHPVDDTSIVSMNAWALTEGFMQSCEKGFEAFLNNLTDPLKQEYYLPTAVWQYSKESGLPLRVQKTGARWYGVTYRQDKETVVSYIQSQIAAGVYPGKDA